MRCSLGCRLSTSPAICKVILEGSGEVGEYYLCRYHRERIARGEWRTVTIIEEEPLT